MGLNAEAKNVFENEDKIKQEVSKLNEMIWEELYRVIRTTYKKLPYHNFSHAEEVACNCLEILGRINKSKLNNEDFDYPTIQKLLYLAALLHDAGHGYYSTKEDEENSAILAEKLLKEYEYSPKEIDYVKKLILATTFGDRKKIHEEWSIIEKVIADADIANSLGGPFKDHLRNEIQVLMEWNPPHEIITLDKVLKLPKSKEWFMEFLKRVTGGNVFLLKETKELFPYSEENLIQLKNLSEEKLKKAFEEEWEKFYWYEFVFVK